VSIFKNFKDSIKKINSQTEQFKKNHQMANIAISKIIESLPMPFDTFLGIVWGGIQKDDNSLQEILKILKRIANNESSFIQITSRINILIEKNVSYNDIMEIATQIKNSNTKITTILDSKLNEILTISKETLDIGHKTRKEVKKLRSELKSDNDNFRKNFKGRLQLVIKNLKTKNQSNYVFGSVNDLIDDVIKLFKERIEKWDVASVKFATKELFDSLYQFSEVEISSELYVIFKDLFSYAHSQRNRLIGTMIEELSHIMLESWENSNNERAEKAVKILLRLGIDFIDRDLDITEDCATAIDNLAGDMFDPKILAKQMLLASSIFERSKNSKSQELVKGMIHNIKWNCRLVTDGYRTSAYLKKAITHAQSEKELYRINFRTFKQKLVQTRISFKIKR